MKNQNKKNIRYNIEVEDFKYLVNFLIVNLSALIKYKFPDKKTIDDESIKYLINNISFVVSDTTIIKDFREKLTKLIYKYIDDNDYWKKIKKDNTNKKNIEKIFNKYKNKNDRLKIYYFLCNLKINNKNNEDKYDFIIYTFKNIKKDEYKNFEEWSNLKLENTKRCLGIKINENYPITKIINKLKLFGFDVSTPFKQNMLMITYFNETKQKILNVCKANGKKGEEILNQISKNEKCSKILRNKIENELGLKLDFYNNLEWLNKDEEQCKSYDFKVSKYYIDVKTLTKKENHVFLSKNEEELAFKNKGKYIVMKIDNIKNVDSKMTLEEFTSFIEENISFYLVQSGILKNKFKKIKYKLSWGRVKNENNA